MVDGMHLLLLALSQDGPSEICSLPRWWWPLCSLCLPDFVGRGEDKEGVRLICLLESKKFHSFQRSKEYPDDTQSCSRSRFSTR